MEKYDLNDIFQGISTLLQSDPIIMHARIGSILLGILLVYLGRKSVLEGISCTLSHYTVINSTSYIEVEKKLVFCKKHQANHLDNHKIIAYDPPKRAALIVKG